MHPYLECYIPIVSIQDLRDKGAKRWNIRSLLLLVQKRLMLLNVVMALAEDLVQKKLNTQ